MLELGPTSREPFWLDVFPGVRIRLRPVSVAAMLVARARVAEQIRSLGDADEDERNALVSAVLTFNLARSGIVEWEEIVGADGLPAPATRENIDAERAVRERNRQAAEGIADQIAAQDKYNRSVETGDESAERAGKEIQREVAFRQQLRAALLLDGPAREREVAAIRAQEAATEKLERAQIKLQALSKIADQRRSVDLTQKEIELVGKNAAENEVVIAELRAKNDLLRAQATSRPIAASATSCSRTWCSTSSAIGCRRSRRKSSACREVADQDDLTNSLRSVCMIPGLGEFAYGTQRRATAPATLGRRTPTEPLLARSGRGKLGQTC